ncbi:MAG: AAA family ATPase [Kiritimatiellae bacterium]|nr:AAA family ATPase [Kiritimatiellia bacterium]
MKRFFLQKLEQWKASPLRKPLILRGLRQTGKTWCLREFANTSFPGGLRLIDFEHSRKWQPVFEADLNPRRIIAELEILLGQPIRAGQTILVFDEVQQCPRALASLRYFYEQMPDLHVAAAGSLLDFALDSMSFPVGRVQFLDLFPMTFGEYLIATGHEAMSELLAAPPCRVSPVIHDTILQELRRYWMTGGMPKCVQTWLDTQSILDVRAEQDNLLSAFQQDFSKYTPRVDRDCLESVWHSAAKAVGDQIIFARLTRDYSGTTNKKAFQVLSMARLLRPVNAASAEGLPLSCVATPRLKAILGDIGLMQSLCNRTAADEWAQQDLLAIYRGTLAEQFVGQELAASLTGDEPHWWKRDSKNSTAEVDYLVELHNGIQPIEVKSGSAGSLKSLHQLLKEHPDCRDGIVLSCAPYAELPEQRLRFIPLYFAGSLNRLD